MARRVAIVGGGITGLATAYYLEKKAREQGLSLTCTLVEAGPRAGGKISTDADAGFVIEGGPDSFVTEKPWALALCHELGLADELIPCNTSDSKVYILKGGKLVPYPVGFRLGIPTRLWPLVTTPLISLPGKLRMALEYVLPGRPAEGDESLARFMGRRFGREAVDALAGPMMAGIFVSDPERMSMRGTFPAFLEMERKHGSLIRAARRAVKHPPPPRPGPVPAGKAMFNSLRGGMEGLVQALQHNISSEVLLNTRVESLSRRDSQFHLGLSGGDSLLVDDLVLALPAHRAADLVTPLKEELAAMMRSIRFVSSATVSLGFLREDMPAERPLDGFGVLVPPRENRRIIACTWSSTKFRNRAPADCVLLRAFVGGYRDEALAEQPDEALLSMVLDECAALFGICTRPIMTRVYRWPKGNPQYDVDHPARVEHMERVAATVPGLHLAGSSYHGIGLPDCVKSALHAVDAIVK